MMMHNKVVSIRDAEYTKTIYLMVITESLWKIYLKNQMKNLFSDQRGTIQRSH